MGPEGVLLSWGAAREPVCALSPACGVLSCRDCTGLYYCTLLERPEPWEILYDNLRAVFTPCSIPVNDRLGIESSGEMELVQHQSEWTGLLRHGS